MTNRHYKISKKTRVGLDNNQAKTVRNTRQKKIGKSPDNDWPALCNISNKENSTRPSQGIVKQQPSSMSRGMRADTSMNGKRGVYDSPHMSIPTIGDVSKIEPLPKNTNNMNDPHNSAGINTNGEESRENGNSPAGNVGLYINTGIEQSDGSVGYQHSLTMPKISDPKEVTQHNGVSHYVGLPQARRTDTIFREQHQQQGSATSTATSWSNVVASNAQFPTTPRLGSRSTSGETLLTSNISQYPPHQPTPNNFHYLNSQSRSRSHSFDSHGSFDNHTNNTYHHHHHHQNSGIPPSHPGSSQYQESTLHSPMMHPTTPYHDFKQPSPRSSSLLGSYSPSSFGGDSMTTDQTSPMSSPSVSPYVSPSMNPRKQQHGDGQPPVWQLSDANGYHSEPLSPNHRLHHNIQSIPEHPDASPEEHHYHNSHHSYSNPPHGGRSGGPTSPPRHLHSPSSGSNSYHQHPGTYPRRPGGPNKPHTGSPTSQTSSHHRSSTEVLKTLLRKKACLYEPETSFAVSLVTWLVGRRLALSQGYFTRQQLQAGVHSCVTSKIDEGHVTRTKVNRCMQVILNSCFHYIIPRPDGSEECGEAFRKVFSRDAADEEHLLRTLPPPWNDLNLPSMTDESHSSLFHDIDDDVQPSSGVKTPNKGSSSASQAGDSLDSGSGGKRSVLLCFNENIRSAADVFVCHNEFIRDVAHTGNLNLSAEDWHSFFSGTKSYNRKRGASPADSYQTRYFHMADMHDRMDQQGLSKLRTTWCAKRYDHDHSYCLFAHVEINRGWLRRDPFVYNYKPLMCPYIKPLQDAEDCYVNMCSLGVKCNHSHSREEVLYHPESYKKQQCKNTAGACPLGDICPNTHAEATQSHGHTRGQGRRHSSSHDYHHRVCQGTKRRGSVSAGGHVTGGFDKYPDGAPMLYIDPAPLSEFEKTLLLPGLQAIFRDHSSSIFYSSLSSSSSCCEFGLFGYRNTQVGPNNDAASTNASIGKPLQH